MAIVKMDKISLIGLDSVKKRLVDELMELGVVEINTQEAKLSDEEWTAYVERDGDDAEVLKTEAEISRIQAVLDTLERYDPAKKPMFRTRRLIGRREYREVLDKEEAINQKIDEIAQINEKLSRLKSEENSLNGLLVSLGPWKGYALPLELSGTQYTDVTIGVLPAVVETDKLRSALCEKVPESELTIVCSDAEQIYISCIYLKTAQEDVMEVLRQFAFNRVVFKDLTGTVAENITAIESKIADIAAERKTIEESILTSLPMKKDIQVCYDKLVMQRDKARAVCRMLRTDRTFYLDGWVPAECVGQVESVIKKYECHVETVTPEKGEDCPVLLKNNPFNTAFEAITQLYSLPSYQGVDPTPLFAPFYFLFYGMMLGDAGYGLLLFLGCFIVLKKFRLEGMTKNMISTLMFAGISTIFWGLMFGSFFGNSVKAATEFFGFMGISLPPFWFDPVEDPVKLLIFSLILGVIHLFYGMGIKAYMMIRDGKPLDALMDVGTWYLLLIGAGMLLLGGSYGLAGIGKWMAIIGAVGIVAFTARDQGSIGGRIAWGLYNLYGATSYLGDILSYSRLLALGLATGVVATVINTMGTLGGRSVTGVILFVVVFVFGHIFNLAINALGSFVHTNRLQYVEFFGKFYEAGGKKFDPFNKRTKYIAIANKEEM